jgi:hypothetical protein
MLGLSRGSRKRRRQQSEMPEDGRSCHEEEGGSSTDTSVASRRGEPKHTVFNSEPWGDEIGDKNPHTLRFALANIDSLPMSRNDVKNDSLVSFCQGHDVDFLGLTEPNKCWHKLPTDDRLRERFFGVWENLHTSVAYNKMNPHATPHQVGGAIGMSFNQAAHRVDSIGGGRGHDPTGLGRWTWTRFRGKGQTCLRVAVVYVPCVSTGPLTVWSQHLAYFNSLSDPAWQDNPDPRQRLFDDLSSAMNEWIEDGDQLLVMGDWNGDVRDLDLTAYFAKHSMHESLLDRHGECAPATCNMGSSPIDGIWSTSSLEITGGGYLNFEQGLPGNHRTLWLDLTYMQALGHCQPAIVRRGARRLKLDDPRCIARYIKYRKAHAKHHNLRAKHISNERSATFPSCASADLIHDQNDALTVAGMKWAEDKCRKYRGGGVPWSPQVEAGRREVMLVEALITRRKGQKIGSRYIRRMEKRLKVQFHHLSLDQLRRQLRKSSANYRKLKGTAEPLRKSFMRDLADARAASNNTTQATELRVMESRREQRALGASMRKMSGKSYQPVLRVSTTEVVTTVNPDASISEGPVTTYHTDKEDIEQASLNEYEKRLNLTIQSPPMVSPLVDDLGYLGVLPACQNILDGTYVTPPGVDHYASQWLSQLKWACPPTDRINPASIFRSCGISTAEHISSWRYSREGIAPGHSGLHPAHWKASCQDPYLASMDAAWANYPLVSGYSPERWRHGVDTLIPKKLGSEGVEDLRPILLFEVDCNMSNKRIGRVMMEMAERNGGLSKEQYGSRKDHSAGIQALNHCLAFDLLRLERRNGVDTAVDLRSCYDLIVHAAASLSMQRQGVPAPSVVCMFTTLQNMVHTVRTAFGESTQHFGGDLWAIPTTPPQGVGQGNGAGPAIWAVVSTPVLEMMRKNGHGAVFRLAIKGEDVRMVGFAFVDDSDILQTATHLDGDIDELLVQAQTGLDCFVGGMSATGGQAKPIKCWWYLINFLWKDGKWSYDTNTASPTQLTVKLPNGERAPLTQKGPAEASEVLGIWLAPDGNNTKAETILTDISRKWADQLRTRSLPKTHAWLAMLSSASKKLEYPLVALTLTEAQCKSIERPLLQQLLKSLGMSKSFPRVVINGPTDSQGLGRRSIYYVMGEIQTSTLLRHFSEDSLTGSMMQASLQRHNLELGIGTSMFQADFTRYSRLATDSWMKHNWSFQHRSQISVKLSAPGPVLQRERDQFLIPMFWNLGYRKSSLVALNRCRMYLQVTTLSDLASGDGTSILDCYWKGQQHPHSHTTYKWPGCGPPSFQDWTTWRSALRTLFYDDAGSMACRRLRVPLGKWLCADDTWVWWFSPSENRLYGKGNNTWRVYLPANGRQITRRSPRFLYNHSSASGGPPDSLRAKVIQLHGDVAFRTTGFVDTLPTESPTLSNVLAERLQTSIPSRSWAMERLQSPDNGAAVAQAIRSNTAICVSDGSFKDQHGTAAFVLVDPSYAEPTSVSRVLGCHVAPGSNSDQSPYRSELSGIYGILCVVEELCALHKVESGSFTIGCDNETCLWTAINKIGTLSPRSKSFDLLSAIRHKISKLPVTVRSHWVEGHQDNYSRDPSRLDIWARLNIEMDSLAKLFWEDSVNRTHRQHEIHGETQFISVRGTKICSSLATGLYSACEGHKLKNYWQERKSIPAARISSINWAACAGAARLLGIGLRFWKTKHVTGIFANGKWMHRWKFWTHSNCPRCGEANEDSSHIVRCPAVTPLWDQVVEPLDSWFSKNSTPPDVSAVILEYIHAWRTQTPPRIHLDRCPSDLAHAISVQSDIGWGLFLEGFVANDWATVMNTHYESVSSRRTGLRWCSGLIHRLWLLLRDLWEHRNAILHDDIPVELQRATTQLNQSVSGQYNLGLNGLSPSHFRSYFTRPLVDILAFTVSYKRNWLANLLAARDHLESNQPTASNRDQERRSLQSWLDLPRRRPRSCRLRPNITQGTRPPVPTAPTRKRKRPASALPDNYSFIPLSLSR